MDFGALAGCVYAIASARLLVRFATRPPRKAESGAPVTIMKPLCGEDPGLYDNLKSFCDQRYPMFQVVCGVQDPADPAIAVVERLKRDHPQRDIVLVVDDRSRTRNLKVANLTNMFPAARHDWLVIVDSDMRVAEDFLSVVMAPLADPGVGLVTCLYRGMPADQSLWSRLAAQHINHGFLPQALLGEALRPDKATFGAGMALARRTLEEVGGFAAIGDTLADDNALGVAVRRRGKHLAVSPMIIDNWLAEPSLRAVFRHELRWALTIRSVAPWGYLSSIITHPLALGVLGVCFGAFLGRWSLIPLTILLVALLSRFAMVRAIDRALELPPTPAWLVLGRDLLSFAVYVGSFCTRTVAWRDHHFHVDRQGQLSLDGDRSA